MTRIPLFIGAPAISLSLAGFAAAQTTATPPGPALTAQDASAIALALQPGTIGEAELDEYDGKPAYDIEVVTEAGQEVEFKIDAATGEVLHTWTDDDPSNDPAPGDAGEASD
ncbi:MAG: PepSY domain-containing protein [Marinibacterium sp.]|nr:PepSY domain-containing protein [Marinibacterium sp.]